MRFALAVFLTFVFVLAFGEKPDTHYIPLTCMSHFVIHDWGKCREEGGRVHCPNTDASFMAGCTSPKIAGEASTPMSIYHPTAVLIDDSIPKENNK